MLTVDAALADFARDILQVVLGPATAPCRIEALRLADTSAVLSLTFRDERQLVLKIAEPGGEGQVDFERTAAATALARAAGAPVPAVLAADNSYRLGPYRYLLLEHVGGVEWSRVRRLLDRDQVAAAHRQIAAAVLALQSVRFGGFGELDRHGEPARVDDLVAALRRRADLRVVDEDSRNMFHSLLDRESGRFAGLHQATLCHDDLHHGNVVFRAGKNRWQLVALLDWDKAWCGPAESDLARMAFWDDMTGPGFWEVYRAAVPATEGEPERAIIYQLLWCLEYDVGSARHAADTSALLRRLSNT